MDKYKQEIKKTVNCNFLTLLYYQIKEKRILELEKKVID